MVTSHLCKAQIVRHGDRYEVRSCACKLMFRVNPATGMIEWALRDDRAVCSISELATLIAEPILLKGAIS